MLKLIQNCGDVCLSYKDVAARRSLDRLFHNLPPLKEKLIGAGLRKSQFIFSVPDLI